MKEEVQYVEMGSQMWEITTIYNPDGSIYHTWVSGKQTLSINQ